MSPIEELCAKQGLDIVAAEEDRGVLVLSLSGQMPSVETLDEVSDALRTLGYRFVSIEFPEAT